MKRYIIKVSIFYLGDTRPCLFSKAEAESVIREINKIVPWIECSPVHEMHRIKYTPVLSFRNALNRLQE